jgi:hypothetical protein
LSEARVFFHSFTSRGVPVEVAAGWGGKKKQRLLERDRDTLGNPSSLMKAKNIKAPKASKGNCKSEIFHRHCQKENLLLSVETFVLM